MQNEPIPFPERIVTGLRHRGMGYRYTNVEHHITLDFDYLKTGDEPSAEVIAAADLPGVPPHLLLQRVRLTGSTSKRDLVKALEEALQAVPWKSIVESACTSVVLAMRRGGPIVAGEESAGSMEPDWLIDKLLMDGKLNALFGPGSNGKGFLALAMGVCVQAGIPFAGYPVRQGNVLYLDWEDDKRTFDDRVSAICRGWGIPFVSMKYRQCTEPLRHQTEYLSRYCTEEKIALAIPDSFTPASGSSAEYQNYEMSAVSLLDAAAALGTTVLFVDHVTGEGSRATGLVGKQYGSIMKQNRIRNNMEVKKDQEYGPRWDIGVYPGKANHGAPRPPMGFHLDFEAVTNGVKITRGDVRKSPVLADALPLRIRIDGMLATGPKPYGELCAGLPDEKKGTVQRAVQRGVQGARYVELSSGVFALRTGHQFAFGEESD
jgi:hypothetical protein